MCKTSSNIHISEINHQALPKVKGFTRTKTNPDTFGTISNFPTNYAVMGLRSGGTLHYTILIQATSTPLVDAGRSCQAGRHIISNRNLNKTLLHKNRSCTSHSNSILIGTVNIETSSEAPRVQFWS